MMKIILDSLVMKGFVKQTIPFLLRSHKTMATAGLQIPIALQRSLV